LTSDWAPVASLWGNTLCTRRVHTSTRSHFTHQARAGQVPWARPAKIEEGWEEQGRCHLMPRQPSRYILVAGLASRSRCRSALAKVLARSTVRCAKGTTSTSSVTGFCSYSASSRSMTDGRCECRAARAWMVHSRPSQFLAPRLCDRCLPTGWVAVPKAL